MTVKTTTSRRDPATRIADAAAVLAVLQTIAPDEYDPYITSLVLYRIARSAGVRQIADLTFHPADDGAPAVTVTTTERNTANGLHRSHRTGKIRSQGRSVSHY